MIKPGKNDRSVPVLIQGKELSELQDLSWMLSDSYGLDSRIARYRGLRPIGLYRWDFECLMAALDHALRNGKTYPDPAAPGCQAIKALLDRLTAEYRKVFRPDG
jgi:hypothetical protein